MDGKAVTARSLGAAVMWLVRVVAVVVACYVGGVAATNLAPTTVTVSFYQAVLRLDVVPRTTPVIHVPTIAGDVNLAFRAPVVAPGLDVAVSVRPEITGLIEANDLSVAALQPSEQDVSDAVLTAARGVGLRFALGALTVAGSLSLAVHYARRRRIPELRHLAIVATAAVVTVGLTSAALFSTYRPGRFAALQSTGVLGALQRNQGLLDEVTARSAQVTPYLRNLLAVSNALQAQFVPAELDQPAALKLLLVSDIHGTNQYPLMKSLIDDAGIDAVIDAGDLVNFGRRQELDASGMAEGIASLGVPYVVITGNHDASAATDREIVRALSAIPNVRLLQTADGDFQEVTIGGLRIAGLNDARYFGDDNQDFEGKLRPSVQAFNAAMANEPEPDIVVIHEPYVASEIERARMVLNGHMHSPSLSGNRIQVGTFTGGGILTHYRSEGEEGAELTGQPYSFDVATFGSGCGLSQLTRYQFHDLLEGRPSYDSVMVVNGALIDPRAAELATSPDPAPSIPANTLTGAPAPASSGTAPTTAPGSTSSAATATTTATAAGLAGATAAPSPSGTGAGEQLEPARQCGADVPSSVRLVPAATDVTGAQAPAPAGTGAAGG